MVAAGVAAVVGVIVGVMPVQVLDQGQWVACGPAMLDGGGRFADLACSGVVQALQTLSVVLLVVALILIGYGVSALRSTRGEPVARSMERASAG